MRGNRVIIAACAGCGKSTFASMNVSAEDVKNLVYDGKEILLLGKN